MANGMGLPVIAGAWYLGFSILGKAVGFRAIASAPGRFGVALLSRPSHRERGPDLRAFPRRGELRPPPPWPRAARLAGPPRKRTARTSARRVEHRARAARGPRIQPVDWRASRLRVKRPAKAASAVAEAGEHSQRATQPASRSGSRQAADSHPPVPPRWATQALMPSPADGICLRISREGKGRRVQLRVAGESRCTVV